MTLSEALTTDTQEANMKKPKLKANELLGIYIWRSVIIATATLLTLDYLLATWTGHESFLVKGLEKILELVIGGISK